MDIEYGQAYRQLYERHWWWRSRTELVVETLRRLQPQGGWKQILDIGCGDGLFFDRLAEFGEIEGVEPAVELVSPTNPHRSLIYTCPFDENFQPRKQYSLILMLDVLEHLENPVAALGHMLSLLRPDGVILLTVPAFMALWTNHDVLNHHMTRYTKRRFQELAREAGFQILEERYLYHWTFPVKLGVRTVEHILHLKPTPAKIPANWANEALFWISRMEQKTLSAWHMPFGSSLMIVGSRGNVS